MHIGVDHFDFVQKEIVVCHIICVTAVAPVILYSVLQFDIAIHLSVFELQYKN